jgi:hypothetical protein
MRRVLVALLLALPAGALAQAPAKAAPKASAAPKIQRTKDGHPDLQGIWTNATITPLERPASLANKAVLTEQEALDLAKAEAEELKKSDGASDSPIIRAAGSSGTGGYNVLFLDRGSEPIKVDGQIRTSLISDPADGKVPPLTDGARRRAQQDMMRNIRLNSVQDRPVSERCLLGFGSTDGPPMLPVLYNNNYQIVQTPETVMILIEMVHDVRTIRINGTHPPPAVRQWLGDSIGHWEGDTLVVETTNFTDKTPFHGSSPDMKVTERFRLTDGNTIIYKATMDDPTTFTRPWSVEYPFNQVAGPIYEYACHEGNYAEADILGGARKAESEPKK